MPGIIPGPPEGVENVVNEATDFEVKIYHPNIMCRQIPDQEITEDEVESASS